MMTDLRKLLLTLLATLAVACSPAPEGADTEAQATQSDEAQATESEAATAPEEESEEASEEDAWFPDNEIFVADLDLSGALPQITSDPVNITGRVGYDNQPAFLPDGSGLLYASIREDDQADPYRYDFASGETSRVLMTAEPEYSPTPHGDGRFSVVRVSEGEEYADGYSQQFWTFDLESGEGEHLLPDVTRIGYFTWMSEDQIAMFVVEEPFSIYLADIGSGAVRKVVEQVGRGLKREPGTSRFGFIDASEVESSDTEGLTGTAWVASFDVETSEVRRLVATPEPRIQDFAWTPDGGLLIGALPEDGQARILYWHPERAPELTEVARLPVMEGVSSPMVTRMAVSPQGDRIAIVVLVNAPDDY